MSRMKMFVGLTGLLTFTIFAFASGRAWMLGSSWSTSGSYTLYDATGNHPETSTGTDTAVTSHTTASVDATPALNSSLVTTCSSSSGGVWGTNERVTLSSSASWTYSGSTPVTPGDTGPFLQGSDYFIEINATANASASAHVEGAGLYLSSVGSDTSGYTTTGYYTDYNGTIVPVSSGSSGLQGTSFGGFPNAGIMATTGGSRMWTRVANPPFTISASSSVTVTIY